MPAAVEVCFPATMDGLTMALATIDQFRAARNLDADQIARMRVVAEELVSNTIKYGYGGACDRPIRLSLSADPVLSMVYEDEAEPFDPTLWRANAPLTVPGQGRREGRAGIDLVLGLSSAVGYMALPKGNRLIIQFGESP